MNAYAVAFKFDSANLSEIKERKKTFALPAGIGIKDAYRVLGENKGGFIAEANSHDDIKALIKLWSDLMSIRVTPVVPIV